MMTPNDQQQHANRVARSSSGVWWVALALFFGIGMALAGFLAGRATAPAQAAVQLSAAPSVAAVATVPGSGTGNIQAASPTTEATPPPASATPLPTAPPTPLPTATIEATAEAPPTVEVIPPPEESPLGTADFATLYEVWSIIADQYDGPAPLPAEIVEAMITGSLETLNDEYTRYVPPDVAERMRQDQDGSVEGIGAFVIENDEGLFEIVRPIDGQPADLVGIQAGDVLIEVDGQSVLDLSFDEVILMVRGPEGTSVNLKFLREGEAEPLEFTVVRTRFEVPVVEFEMLPPEIAGEASIGYVRLAEFSNPAEDRLLVALDELLTAGATGLVLDLRDNPGGFLNQSVAVADAFLPEGVVLFERNIRGLDDTFRTDDGDAAETIPLVVLVNAGSASASEIVAGALQDRGRAVLVGETTFGKGSVQQIHPLSDGSELRVTVARWYTPNNNSINDVGITPDFEVETPEDLGGPDDGQLRRAVDYLLTGQ
jgi:carboxyl-terminal processing protease